MKKMLLLAFIGILITRGHSAQLENGQRQLKEVTGKYLPLLLQLASEKSIIQDVLSRNKIPISAEQANKIQADWAQIGISESEKQFLYNNTTQTIRAYEYKIQPMVKCFVLDQFGNVVGTVPDCKDFIHGQMNKFLKCYNHGKGRIYYNPPRLDVSTKIYSVQVSVPIISNSTTIGVLVATLSLE